ncbi:MAG: glycosyltransferase family 2 protein [Planctomycetes bacterium]|nr:glycosyltransferase family 2 protein [Planctomycetota bacterium]
MASRPPGSSPTISIVVSTYNSAELLRACLGQLSRQSAIGECEVLVIDSGSEQNEAAVCTAFQTEFPALLYERTPRETVYSAWNRALTKARGRYFVNANTDDSLHPHALSLLKRALDRYPEAVIAYGDWIWSNTPNASFPVDPSCPHIRHEAYHPSIPLTYCYTGCTQFWRTEKLRQLGGFRSQRWAAADYEALTDIVRRRWAAAYVPTPVAAHYKNPAGLSLASNRSFQEFCEIRNALRAQVPISAIYDVDEADATACAAGWVGLAQRALHVYAPWAAGPDPDFDYATFAAQQALTRDPSSRPAKRLLKALARKQHTLWDKLLRRRLDRIRGMALSRVPEPPPRVKPLVAAIE